MSVKLHEKFQNAVYDASVAGKRAVEGATVQPMYVGSPKNLVGSLTGGDDGGFDPDQPIYFVEGGPCGFAWVNIKATSTEGRKFLNWLKGGVKTSKPVSDVVDSRLIGEPRLDSYYKGVSIWVHVGGQSMQRKEVFGRAFAKSLRESGIDGLRVHMMSRMD